MAETQSCQACGATIYPEHIDQGRAGRWAGQLLCTVCYAEKRNPPAAKEEPTPAEPAEPKAGPANELDEPISLVDVEETGKKIQTFGRAGAAKAAKEREFKRQPTVTGKGACRVRTFHSKLQIESIEFMDNAINDWLDDNPDIEVKFVTSTIGVMAGKFPEPNLILNLWY